MSTFWAGAGAALVGAIIGGLFTALAARMQAKSSLQAINHQLQQTFAHERQQRNNEVAREGMTRLLIAVNELIEILGQISEQHGKCGGHCTRETLPIAALKAWRYQYLNIVMVYGHGTLADPEQLEGLLDITNELIAIKSADEFPQWEINAIREYSPNRDEQQDACNYRLAANKAMDEFVDVTNNLGHALQELT